MAQKVKKIGLKEKLEAGFADIHDQITTNDRNLIMEEKGFSKQFLSNYLNGRGADLDVATEILVFMRARIKSREDKVAIPL